MLRKNYSHVIPAIRTCQKYKGGSAVAPTAAPVAAGITLTTGSVPQNLRCLTAGQALPGGGVRGQVSQTYDSSGKLMGKTVTGLV